MRAGDLVRFKVYEHQEEWMVGLLLQFDSFMKIGKIFKIGEKSIMLFNVENRKYQSH